MQFKSDYLSLHGLVLLNSFIPIVAKSLTLDPVATILYRTLIAALALGLVCLITQKQIWKGGTFVLQMLGIGLLTSLFWILLFFAPKLGNASVTSVAIATSSLWISFLSPLMTKDKFSFYQVIIGLNAIFGIYMIFNDGFNQGWGLAIGVLAAIIGGIVTIINGKVSRKYDHFTVTFYQMSGAFIGTACFFPFYDIFMAQSSSQTLLKEVNSVGHYLPSFMDWIYLIMLALVFSVFAYTMLIKILKTVSPFLVSLTLNLTPVYGLILSVLVFGKNELMNLYFYSGATIIIASVMVTPVANLLFSDKGKVPKPGTPPSSSTQSASYKMHPRSAEQA